MKSLVRSSVLTAIISVAIMSCNSGGSGTKINVGDAKIDVKNAGTEWASATLLSKFGLDGMSKPQGFSDGVIAENTIQGESQLFIQYTGNAASAAALKSYFTDKGWEQVQALSANNVTVTVYEKEANNMVYRVHINEIEGNIQLAATKKPKEE